MTLHLKMRQLCTHPKANTKVFICIDDVVCGNPGLIVFCEFQETKEGLLSDLIPLLSLTFLALLLVQKRVALPEGFRTKKSLTSLIPTLCKVIHNHSHHALLVFSLNQIFSPLQMMKVLKVQGCMRMCSVSPQPWSNSPS